MTAGATRSQESRARLWARRVAFLLAALIFVAAAAYATRRTLMLEVAKVFLDREDDLVAQERADGVRVVFAKLPSPWTAPMKNVMNPMWQPIGAEGVNYYAFGGPRNVFATYSERSDPRSAYYQAWVGAYVTKRRDGTLPQDVPAWAKQVTELDQRSWLAAMGDPAPLAEAAPASSVGSIVVDGRTLPLWRGSMRSHSDLSETAATPLAALVGMPAQSSWPAGVASFHDVTLDGYFVCWSDATRRVSIVVYAVAAMPSASSASGNDIPRNLNDELLRLMATAKVETIH